jgi:hypothetical protein
MVILKGNQIMLSRKPQIEDHRKSAEGKLAARLELLKNKGINDKLIQKDAKIKQFKAQIRKAKHQMAGIAAVETLISGKAEAKVQKKAAAEAPEPRQESKKAAKSAAPKKPKKEKKPAAAEK